MSKTTNKFSPEVRERAVQLVLDTEAQQGLAQSGDTLRPLPGNVLLRDHARRDRLVLALK